MGYFIIQAWTEFLVTINIATFSLIVKKNANSNYWEESQIVLGRRSPHSSSFDLEIMWHILRCGEGVKHSIHPPFPNYKGHAFGSRNFDRYKLSMWLSSLQSIFCRMLTRKFILTALRPFIWMPMVIHSQTSLGRKMVYLFGTPAGSFSKTMDPLNSRPWKLRTMALILTQ